jgi:transposase|nr:hypothetical protein [Prevotella nigrescens]
MYSPSTVGREISRNRTETGKYVWDKADDIAVSRSRRISEALRWRVKQLITDEQWSPGKISGLVGNCRHKMTYHWRHSKVRETKATNIKNRVSIHERPAETDGKRFGVCEMDLIVDSNSNAILTVIERSANFLLMAKT